MNRYDTRDLKFSDDGDFMLDENGDFALAEGNELILQNVAIPIKSTNPEWNGEDFPADLEDLLGLENSRATVEIGKTKIKQSLIRTGFFEEGDIWIEAKPLNLSNITFFVFINSPFSSNPLVYQVDLDLGFGVSSRRVH